MEETTPEQIMRSVLNAWESLYEGDYSGNIIKDWLVNDMAPAIDQIRKYFRKHNNN